MHALNIIRTCLDRGEVADGYAAMVFPGHDATMKKLQKDALENKVSILQRQVNGKSCH